MQTERASGILLHITSLPGPHGIGDIGGSARRFVDYLAEAGQTYWQVLPLGPTGLGDSPYTALIFLRRQPAAREPGGPGRLRHARGRRLA